MYIVLFSCVTNDHFQCKAVVAKDPGQIVHRKVIQENCEFIAQCLDIRSITLHLHKEDVFTYRTFQNSRTSLSNRSEMEISEQFLMDVSSLEITEFDKLITALRKHGHHRACDLMTGNNIYMYTSKFQTLLSCES